MRVVMISKALVVGAYQRKLEAMAALPGVELTAVVPPAWQEPGGARLALERAFVQGYRLVVTPIVLNGNYHLHFYPRLGRVLAEAQPDLVHIDEEPYNLAAWHALNLARRLRARTIFFSWQNLRRRYPWPFRAWERAVLARADGALVGSHEAAGVWRAKGYSGPLRVVPQFGVDPDQFSPGPPRAPGADFTIGSGGRLVPEKGLDLLLQAAATLGPGVRVRLVGAGPERESLLALAARLGLGERFTIAPRLPSTETPRFYRSLDCLVLASRSLPNWKEQFGRVLVEAMACGVPVVTSTCGEAPNVVGDAGLVFPEGDPAALAAHLRALQADPALRAHLARAGRERVLAHFTQQAVAQATVAFYGQVLAGGQPAGDGA